jgi:cell fate (sporulation/competence/biofilm development) regulator YlbF (YheA/YmcA/DUF963 family)
MEPRVEMKAKELAEELARSEACARLEKAKEEISKRAAAQIMLRDLQERQKRLQAKAREGQQPTETEIQDFQRMSQIAAMNPYIRQLFDAQNELLAMIMAVQSLLMKAVNLEPEVDEEAEAKPEAEAGNIGSAGESQNKGTGMNTGQTGQAGQAEQAGQTGQTEQKPRSRLWVPGGYR